MIHAPTHSALVVHKGRPEHLRLFLQSFARALTRARAPEWEMILVDYDDVDCFAYLNNPKWLVSIQVDPIPVGQPLNKAKALNRAFSFAVGEYVTILDVDCLMPQDFLQSIERMIWTHAPTKIAHHVRWLDPAASDAIRKDGLGIMDTTVFRKLDRYNRYTEEYENRLTGCSQQTIKGDAFSELNGFDERYIGYGHEDVDFNIRAFDLFGPPVFHDSAGNELVHLWHTRSDEWHNDQTDKGNRALFEANKAAGFPLPPIPASWDDMESAQDNDSPTEEAPKRKTCECNRNKEESTPHFSK